MQEIEKKFLIELNGKALGNGKILNAKTITDRLCELGIRPSCYLITQLYLRPFESTGKNIETRLRIQTPKRNGKLFPNEATITACSKTSVRQGGILNRTEEERQITQGEYDSAAESAEKKLVKLRIQADKAISFDIIQKDGKDIVLCEVEFPTEAMATMFTSSNLADWLCGFGTSKRSFDFVVTDVTRDPSYRSWTLAEWIEPK